MVPWYLITLTMEKLTVFALIYLLEEITQFEVGTSSKLCDLVHLFIVEVNVYLEVAENRQLFCFPHDI